MKHYPSISDFLEAYGYTAENGAYQKKEGDLTICIPASEWSGKSLSEFIRKAQRNLWVPEHR